MLYSQPIYNAINLMCEAHGKTLDKSGIPYIFHPYHVAEQMKTEDSVIAALLHDVLEDTEFTPEMLKERGISDRVISALLLLTHRRGVPYMDYIREIKQDPISREVKIADLRHNLDETRLLGNIPEKLKKKRPVYLEALDYLLSDD